MTAPAAGSPTTDAAPDSGPDSTPPPALAPVLDLGGRRYDLTHRALVMGILNRTPDSFYDKGATFELDKLYARAEQLVTDGADILDVGGVKAGPGPEVAESEELDRIVPVVSGLAARFDTPVSVDTWRASVARASYAEGAVMGNDISGLADPDYAAAAADHPVGRQLRPGRPDGLPPAPRPGRRGRLPRLPAAGPRHPGRTAAPSG